MPKHTTRLCMAAAGLLSASVLTACGDASSTQPQPAPQVNPAVALAVINDAVVQGTDNGAFTNSIAPTNASGAYWDNTSEDGTLCNMGYYALGTSTGCTSGGNAARAAASDANKGGGYDKYWGSQADPKKAASFLFSGARSYSITLKGSYIATSSVVGRFLKSDPSVCLAFPNVNINSVVGVGVGEDWGFCIQVNGGAFAFSNAVSPTQQRFALFSKSSDPNAYLVGAEDQTDRDNNDYMWSVVADAKAPPPPPLAVFVIGDLQAHALGANIYFWGAQWWKNNPMSGSVANGVASFKGYATSSDNVCGGGWASRPGNSSNPPDVLGPQVLIVVTTTVGKSGPNISGTIKEILLVNRDGGYAPNPGHEETGVVAKLLCK